MGVRVEVFRCCTVWWYTQCFSLHPSLAVGCLTLGRHTLPIQNNGAKVVVLRYVTLCDQRVPQSQKHFPQTVLALTRSYLGSIVSPLEIRIAGGQPKYLSLKYLSPAANSLEIRIAGGQPKYLSLKYLSPAANSLEIRIVGGQPRYLSPGT